MASLSEDACPVCGTWECDVCGWRRHRANRFAEPPHLHTCGRCGSGAGTMVAVVHNRQRREDHQREAVDLVAAGRVPTYPLGGALPPVPVSAHYESHADRMFAIQAEWERGEAADAAAHDDTEAADAAAHDDTEETR